MFLGYRGGKERKQIGQPRNFDSAKEKNKEKFIHFVDSQTSKNFLARFARSHNSKKISRLLRTLAHLKKKFSLASLARIPQNFLPSLASLQLYLLHSEKW